MYKIIALFLFCFSQFAKAQLVGLLLDSSNAPIAGVQIFDKNGTKLGQGGLDGYFKLELRPGDYRLIFSHPEFANHEMAYLTKENQKDTITLILKRMAIRLDAVVIRSKWKDPGPEMMRKAIARRSFWASRIPAQSANVYIRAFEETKNKKEAPKPTDENLSIKTDDPERQQAPTSPKKPTPNIQANMVEISMKRDWYPPNKVKEIREGVSVRGDKTSLFYLSTLEGDFNIYQNLMNLPGLCPLPIMSPLSSTAILAYRFRFIESYKDSVHGRVLRIKFDGRQTSNATFNGEIHIVDTAFYVSKIVINIPRHLMAEYDEMQLSQGYRLTKDSFILIDSQSFKYQTNTIKQKVRGETRVKYNNIVVNPVFPKNHFGLELSRTEQEAYERDSSYWEKERKVPLSMVERTFISKSDSIKRILTSDAYLDSIERKQNKITFRSLVLEGQEYHNRKKGIDLNFQPLWLIYQPWWPGGDRILLWSGVSKTFESKRSIQFNENISYGARNNDIRGSVTFNTLYNPYKRKRVVATAGRDFGLINPFAAFLDVFRRNNFYQHDHLSVYHRQEVVNGLFFRIRGEYSDRKDISGLSFAKSGDSLFENNVALNFSSHKAIFASVLLSYTPYQKYISEPKQKIILGSAWPTFSIEYKKAVPGVLGSTIDYDYLEYRIEHNFPWGLFGYSELRANSGSFITRKNINVIDYRYQRRGDAFIFTPPMFAFQTLDSSFITFKRFYEVHYRHHFNGSLLNKIPFMKKLSLYESAGVNILYAPERRNLFFYEAYAGFDKLIKIWRERFKIGVYYCVGYSNIYDQPRATFKINFEFFDRAKNSW